MVAPAYPPDIWLPLRNNWEWQSNTWETTQSLAPVEKKLLLQDKDMLSPSGWIMGGGLQADSPKAGVHIEYTGPKGRLIKQTYTIQALYDYGLNNIANPSSFSVTRWAQSAPEYALILWWGFGIPYRPKFSFYILNAGVLPINIYKLTINFLCLFEEPSI